MVIAMNCVNEIASGVLLRLFRRKSMARESRELNTSQLARVLTVWDLTALGVGSTLGIGIYVLAGTVAKMQAGPAVILSFVIAAFASLLAGLCFAEFGARVPSCGSAYVYCYVTVGEGLAFLMGWNLILEFVLCTSSVARGYSGYVDELLGNPMRSFFVAYLPMHAQYIAAYPDMFAFILVLTLTAILTLGVKESTRFNNLFTLCNLLIVAYIVICGCFKIDFHNWNIKPEEVDPSVKDKVGAGGFLPFGLTGVVAGAGTCFFGFQGFDTIATASEEAQNPRKTIPLAIFLCLLIVFLAYSGIAAVLTLMWPFYLQDPDTPFPYAFEQLGWPVAKWVVSIGTLFGLSTSLVGALFPLPRIVYSMAEDGLLFKFLSKINYRTLTPVFATVTSGAIAATFACLFNLQDLVDLMALATLFVFGIVAACIIILRYQPENNMSVASESGEVTGLLAGVAHSQLRRHAANSSYDSSAALRQAFFARHQIPTAASGRMATWMTIIYVFAALGLSLSFTNAVDALARKELWALTLVSAFTSLVIVSLVVIARLPQSPLELSFRVPFVPLIPALSIMVNVYLMVNMRAVTWVQYTIYMTIGMLVYMIYGWRNSKEEERLQGKYNLLNEVE